MVRCPRGLARRTAGRPRCLDDAGVDYALVGALAVAVWGAPRTTKDLDLLVRLKDLERARTAVRAKGFTLDAFPVLPLSRKSKKLASSLNMWDRW